MVEHPMPVLGYSNAAHFKISDQANAVAWLQTMFVFAEPDALHLGRALPRCLPRSLDPPQWGSPSGQPIQTSTFSSLLPLSWRRIRPAAIRYSTISISTSSKHAVPSPWTQSSGSSKS